MRLLEGSGLPVAGEVSLVLSHASIAERSYVWFGFGVGVGGGWRYGQGGEGEGEDQGEGEGKDQSFGYLAVHGENRVGHQLPAPREEGEEGWHRERKRERG